MRTYRIR